MKVFCIAATVILMVLFLVSPAYSEPSERGLERGRGHEMENHGHHIDRQLNEHGKTERDIQEIREINREMREMRENVRDMKEEHAKWAQNPNDVRGQGNMGKPDMLDPYGQNKDPARLETYGSRGRVVKEAEPEPAPTPEPVPQPEPEPPIPPLPPFFASMLK